jgi:hypothetical protein
MQDVSEVRETIARVRPGTEVCCRGCGHAGVVQPGAPDCPTCGAGLFHRVSPPVTPLSHSGALLSAVFSLRGVMFAAVYAGLVLAPIPFTNLIAYGLLCTAAVQLSWKAMLAKPYRVDFPEVGLDLLELRWMLPVIVFSVVFLIAPTLLLGAGIGMESDAVVAGAVALYAFGPLGLLGYLRHGTTFGFFTPGTAWTLFLRDPAGLLGVALAFLGVIFGGIAIDTLLSTSLLGSAAGSAVWAIALLYAFGLCGLFLRKHSRALRLGLDDDEWAPIRVVTMPGSTPYAEGRTLQELRTYPNIPMPEPRVWQDWTPAPRVEIDRVERPLRSGFQVLPARPVVTGTPVEEPRKTTVPDPIEIDWLPPSQGGEV